MSDNQSNSEHDRSDNKPNHQSLCAKCSRRRPAKEPQPPRVRFADSTKQEDGPSTVGVQRIVPRPQEQQPKDDKGKQAAESAANQPVKQPKSKSKSKASGSSSKRYTTGRHCGRPDCTKRHIIKHPPVPHDYPSFHPPLPSLTTAYATISSNNTIYQASEAAKRPKRERALELEEYTTWQHIKWRCKMEACCEFEDGYCYKTVMRAKGEAFEGDGEGWCETRCMRWCCVQGLKVCGVGECCEGGGCVKCCGWEHGFWDGLDVCFGGEGWVASFMGVLEEKWKAW